MTSLSATTMEEYKRTQPKLPQATTNKARHEQVKAMFRDDKHHEKIVDIVHHLASGKSMVPKELAQAMGYANVDSRGYRDPKNILLEHDIVEMVSKNIQLTDHMFPEGRP